MKWFLLIFQLVSSFKTIAQTKAIMEKAKDVAVQSKKMAFFSFTLLVAFVYLIAGTIVAAISIGNQIDSGNSFQWTGMLWASLGLAVFGFFVFTIGLIVLKFPDRPESRNEVVVNHPTHELTEALEKLAITFINQMMKNLIETKETQTSEKPEGSR